jgi:cob(I)alamin adenosyltransferase
MKIYTRTGDDGSTGLYGGGRVAKCDLRLQAVGAVDELNAQLGVARTLPLPRECDEILDTLQNQMFDLGAELATPDAVGRGTDSLQDAHVSQVEGWIDRFEAGLPPLQTFILPGGSPGAATLHLARCICRRAERQMVALSQVAGVRDIALRYINRVSDLLFVLARASNAELGQPDVTWKKVAVRKD